MTGLMTGHRQVSCLYLNAALPLLRLQEGYDTQRVKGGNMILDEILDALDISSASEFRYFEQFSELMETDFEGLEYDDFAELMLMPDHGSLSEMTESFFEDLIKGIPDDNTDLYSVIQSIKDALMTLAAHTGHRGRGFYADELFRFREWLLRPEAVECRCESDGHTIKLSALDALMLFREEKLSGRKFSYGFSDHMPEGPDEYTLNAVNEAADDPYEDDTDWEAEDTGCTDELPIELPSDWDPDTWDPDDPLGLRGPIDPYTDGFVDRYRPVIDGEYDDDDHHNYNYSIDL